MPSNRYRFVNLDGSGPHALTTIVKWAVVDRVLGRREPAPGSARAPSVLPDVAALQHPPAAGEGGRLTWIGHASWLVQLDGVSLLIDPVLSDSIGPGVRRRVPAALDVADLPSIDAQLVTHNHRDHLDLPSLQRVRRRVIAGLGLGPFFAQHALVCSELEWWQEARVGPVSVRFVPSQHWSRRGFSDENATLWGGFVIEGSSARVYHSGDTAYFAGFEDIGQRCGPIDAAILPIGAYAPQWFMGKQHMNPEEAVRACGDLRALHFVAMHWGTFQLTDEPLDEPPARLKAEWQRLKLDPARCHIPPIGGTLSFRRDRSSAGP